MSLPSWVKLPVAKNVRDAERILAGRTKIDVRTVCMITSYPVCIEATVVGKDRDWCLVTQDKNVVDHVRLLQGDQNAYSSMHMCACGGGFKVTTEAYPAAGNRCRKCDKFFASASGIV